MSGSRSVPVDDGLKDAPDDGSSKHLYQRHSWKDVLVAWKWPIVAVSTVLLLVITALLWRFGIPTIPAPVWGSIGYFGIAAGVAAVPAYLLVKRWRSVEGVELLELNPVTGKHRHIRVGPELWSDVEVRSPWGAITESNRSLGLDDLTRCSINGRSGYEVMDFRILDDGRPSVTATWLGEADGSQFRAYKSAYRYAHERLSKRADKANLLRANQGEIAREAAEAVVYKMIQTSEQSGMPHGGEIESVVDDVLRDAGMGDPLDDDLRDDRLDQLRDEPEQSELSEPDQDVSVSLSDVTGGQPAATDGGTDQ